MVNFLFQKQNLTIARNWQLTQIQKKKKMTGQSGKKKTLQKTFFTYVLAIAREIPKPKGKNQCQLMKKKMCQLIFLKIYVPTATEK